MIAWKKDADYVAHWAHSGPIKITNSGSVTIYVGPNFVVHRVVLESVNPESMFSRTSSLELKSAWRPLVNTLLDHSTHALYHSYPAQGLNTLESNYLTTKGIVLYS